jgi:hypothetical protein
MDLRVAWPTDSHNNLHFGPIEIPFVPPVSMSRKWNEMVSRKPLFPSTDYAFSVHRSYSTNQLVARELERYKISAPRGRVADGGLMFPPEQLVSRFYFEMYRRFTEPRLRLTALLSTRKKRLQAHFQKNFASEGCSVFELFQATQHFQSCAFCFSIRPLLPSVAR